MDRDASAQTSAVGDAIYDRFFAELRSRSPDGERLATELRQLRELGEIGRDAAIIEAFGRILRQTP